MGTAVARPVLTIVTCELLEEVHAQVLVISAWLLSLNVPVAVNCFVLPRGILTWGGVVAMDFSVTIGEPLPVGALLPPHPAKEPRRSTVHPRPIL